MSYRHNFLVIYRLFDYFLIVFCVFFTYLANIYCFELKYVFLCSNLIASIEFLLIKNLIALYLLYTFRNFISI